MAISSRGRAALFVLGIGEIGAGCSPLCDGNSWSPDSESCQYKVEATCDSARIDIRKPGEVSIGVQIMRQSQTERRSLASGEQPQVSLQLDSGMSLAVVSQPSSNPPGLKLMPDAGSLVVGPLAAQVSVRPTLTGTAAGCRVFRSPSFRAADSVAFMPTVVGGVSVTGGTSLQFGSPAGYPTFHSALLIGEQLDVAGTPKRWLEGYQVGPAGTVTREPPDAGWQNRQAAMLSSSAAQLVLASGAVAIYDGGKDLTILPLMAGNRTFPQTDKIPTDGTAIAAAADDQLLLIARPQEVRWYRLDLSANPMQPVSFLGTLTVSGTPIIAARAEKAAHPSLPAVDFFAVVWEKGGKAMLLHADQIDGGLTQTLSARPLDADAQASFLQALVADEGISAAALADLDSDGLQDLVVATSTGRLLWAPQLAGNKFDKAAALAITQAGAVGLAVGDINADDRMDLAVLTSDQKVVVFRNQP